MNGGYQDGQNVAEQATNTLKLPDISQGGSYTSKQYVDDIPLKADPFILRQFLRQKINDSNQIVGQL